MYLSSLTPKQTKLLRYGGSSLLVVMVFLILLNLFFPLKIDIEYSQIITDKDNNIIHAYLTSDDKWRMKTTLEEITPELQKAIIHKEDKYFNYHFGINPIAIFRAFFNNIVQGRRTSGASTITMQVARLLHPKERSYWNKIVEIFRAIQLEWKYSKKEILQLYLNLVPYGGNLEGVKSAAVLYFDKAPNHLNIAEITVLAIVPNRPTSLKLGKKNKQILAARNKWLKRFKEEKVFSATTIQDALEEELIIERKDAPKTAPHFSYRIKKTTPNQSIIKTSLNFNQQKKVEKIVQNYIKRIYKQHIKNASVMVINNQTNTVACYVGSADFFNNEDAGQVDGVRAIRSPGSTLKPFLTALAIDKGKATPKLKVNDVPVNFSGYSPVNYDNTYNGAVTVEYALANSLNVPSVKLLEEIGSDFFINQLIEAGFKKIEKNKQQLGLSVVLGGCGVSLEELTRLYASFAHKGRLQSLQWTANDTITLQKPLVSEGAAYIVTDILTKLTRPDLPKNFESSKHLPKIAWKTGTSYGRRDAWSVGYNANYTIGVWVGNFSGEGVVELTGASIATPLLFKIFNALDYAPVKDWFKEPDMLDFRWVCSETGLVPSPFCENQVIDTFLPLVSSTKVCKHVQEVWVSADEKKSYCRSCLPMGGSKKKLFPSYPPEIINFYETENINYERIPPHNSLCERVFKDKQLSITSPVNGVEYIIDASDNDQLMLTCQASNDVKKVYWYVNDIFYRSENATENVFFVPKIGQNKVTCVDDKGRKKIVTFEVKTI